MKDRKSAKLMVLLVIGSLVMGLLGGCGQTQKDEMINVGILQYVEHGSLDLANEGFVAGLGDNGYKEGVNVTFDRQNAQGDQSNLKTIADRFVNDKVDLICAIATPAAQAVAGATETIPIVATSVTDFAEAKLVKDNALPGTNVTGTTDMNPIKEQIDLLLQFKPDAKTVGVIYSAGEANSGLQVAIMREYVESLGLTVEEATVATVNDIQQAAQNLVTKSDVIYVPTDNIMASAMSNLVQITDAEKLPVVCGATSMVEAGGLATLGIDYYKLGYQTGFMAAKVLNGEATPAEMPIESLTDMDFIINKEVADRLGIEIPADMLAKATKVVE